MAARTLKKCLDDVGRNLDPAYIDTIKSLARENKKDGYSTHEAGVHAVNEVLIDIGKELKTIYKALEKPAPEITTKGKPYKSEKMAAAGIKRAGKEATHEVVKVEDGWVGRVKSIEIKEPSKPVTAPTEAKEPRPKEKVRPVKEIKQTKEEKIAELEKQPKFQADQLPGQGVELSDIQKQFKGQAVFMSPDGSISVRFKTGQGTVIKTVKQIADGDYQFAIDTGQMSDQGVILGKTEGNVITLDKTISDPATLAHETKHVLDNLGIITNADNMALQGELIKLRKQDKFNYPMSKHKDKKIAREENLANVFAQVLKDRKDYRGTRIGKITQKVMDFFDALIYIGRQSTRKLAREVETGKVFEREAVGAGLKTKVPAYEKAAGAWYSKMQQVLDQKLNTATPSMMKTQIQSWAKKGMFKQEELEWSGVIPWLESKTGKVTKQEVLEYLEQNQVVVEDVVKSAEEQDDFIEVKVDKKTAQQYFNDEQAITDENGNEILTQEDFDKATEYYFLKSVSAPDETKFAQYQLPGGESYREVLLTLPAQQFDPKELRIVREELRIHEASYIPTRDFYDRDTEKPTAWAKKAKELRIRLAELKKGTPAERKKSGAAGRTDEFKSTHFEEKNILAHIRMSERTIDGKRVLHIEELQSDFAQAKRKGEKVPKAPFVGKTSSWVMLAMKRMVRYAAENVTSANSAFIEATKPDSVGKQLKDQFGSELAFVSPLEAMDAVMLSASKNDKVRKAVIKAIPVNVMNILSNNNISADALLSESNVYSKALPINSRSTVARGLSEAFEFVGTRLRAALYGVLSSKSGRGNKKLFSTISTNDLNHRIVVGLLSPSTIYRGDELGRDVSFSGFSSTKAATKNTIPGIDDTLIGRELSSAKLAILLNRHFALLNNSSSYSVTHYIPESQYDFLAWTQGAEQAERYDLSKQVDSIDWQTSFKGPANTDPQKKYISLNGLKGISDQTLEISVDAKTGIVGTMDLGAPSEWKGKHLSDVLGKEVSDKILKRHTGELKEDGLKVGGEGMKAFYDRILPNEVNKFFNKKAWGKAKVGEIEIDAGTEHVGIEYEDDGASFQDLVTRPIAKTRPVMKKLHALPITPKMKSKALREGMPLFAVKEPVDIAEQEDPFTVPQVSTRFEDFHYNIVDILSPVSKVYKSIKKKIPEKADYFLKEKLRISRAAGKIKRAGRDYYEPIKKIMGFNKFDSKDVDEFLYARHAPEANERLRLTNSRRFLLALAKAQKGNKLRKKIDALDAQFELMEFPTLKVQETYQELLKAEMGKAKTDAELSVKNSWQAFIKKPSGMTDIQASALMQKWSKNEPMAKIAEIFDKMNANSLDISYQAGRISEDAYNAIKGTYDYYAPLQRKGHEVQKGFSGIGKGLVGMGQDFKIRGGSTKKAVNILGNAMMNHEKVILTAEKARASEAFLNLVKLNPNPDFWWFEKAKMKTTYDEDGNIELKPDQEIKDNEVKIKSRGETYVIGVDHTNIHAMRIINHLKGNNDKSGAIVNALSKFNRILAMVNTTLNPEFILRNFTKDLQTAFVNLESTKVAKMKKQIIKNIPKAMKGLHDSFRGEGKTGWGKKAAAYEDAGAKIGWIDYGQDIEKRVRDLDKEVNLYKDKGHFTQKTINKIGQTIEDYNSIVENAVRLSTYQAGLDSGLSKDKSALMAKNLTVNFNQKGAWGQVMNSLYLFSNAGVQGSARMLSGLRDSPKARKIVGGMVISATSMAIANSMAGGEDDEGIKYYDKIDDYIKQTNMIIMIPNSKGKYIKIPTAWGFNVFWSLGTEIGDAIIKDDYNAMEGASRMVDSALNAFNPVHSATMLQTLMPTILDPVAMVGENKTFFGSPLMPEKNPFERIQTPDSERYWKSVRPTSKFIAKWANKLTGGDKIKKGLADISPETLDLVLDTFTGGAGRFIADTLSIPQKIIEGDTKIKDYPFARSFVGSKSEYKAQSDFYKNIEHIRMLNAQIKEYPQKAKSIRKDKTFLLLSQVKATEKKLRGLRKILKKTKNKETKKRFEQSIERIQNKFNKQFNRMSNQ